MSDDTQTGCQVFFALILAAVISGFIVSACNKQGWQKEAIDHGYAEYDGKTGEWKWKADAMEKQATKGE